MVKKVLGTFLVLILISGCTQVIQPTMTNIIFLEGTDKKFQIVNEAIARNSGNLLEVEVDLLNLDNYMGELAYRVDWRDVNGFTINTIMSRWIYTEVEPHSEVHIKAVAPTSKAINHRIRVMKPNSYDKDRTNSYQYQQKGD